MRGIIGAHNAGFDIIEAERCSERQGYCIGESKTLYVTWRFVECEYNGKTDVSFYHGHYFMKDPDAPTRTTAKVKADYHERLSHAFAEYAKYGY